MKNIKQKFANFSKFTEISNEEAETILGGDSFDFGFRGFDLQPLQFNFPDLSNIPRPGS